MRNISLNILTINRNESLPLNIKKNMCDELLQTYSKTNG